MYASGGASLIISVLTDNPNRAAAEVKNAVNKASKNSAKMAESGSVTYLYERKGRMEFEKGLVDEEKVSRGANGATNTMATLTPPTIR